MLSDSRPQLAAKLFQEAGRLMGVPNVFTSTYHPQTNEQVERMNRTSIAMRRDYVSDQQCIWDDYLPALAFAYYR